jgi:hypothetical protein
MFNGIDVLSQFVSGFAIHIVVMFHDFQILLPFLFPLVSAQPQLVGAANYCNAACVSLTAQYAAVVPQIVVDVANVPK